MKTILKALKGQRSRLGIQLGIVLFLFVIVQVLAYPLLTSDILPTRQTIPLISPYLLVVESVLVGLAPIAITRPYLRILLTLCGVVSMLFSIDTIILAVSSKSTVSIGYSDLNYQNLYIWNIIFLLATLILFCFGAITSWTREETSPHTIGELMELIRNQNKKSSSRRSN